MLINIALLIIAVMVIVIILAQSRGAGLGGVFGGQGESTFRTRRGIERTLFRFTVLLVTVFVLLALLSVRLT